MMTTTHDSKPNEQDVALAKAVADWMFQLSLEDSQPNDYMANLATYGKLGVVNERGLGFVASAVNAYNRKLADEVKAKTSAALAATSKFVGAVGERLTLKVRLVGLIETVRKSGTYEGEALHVHKFVDVDGNSFTWFSSVYLWPTGVGTGGASLEIGSETWIAGTVLGHKEFNGVKETTLSRVKLVADPSIKKAKVKKVVVKNSEVIRQVSSEWTYSYVEALRAVQVFTDGTHTGWEIQAREKTSSKYSWYQDLPATASEKDVRDALAEYVARNGMVATSS